MFSMSRAEKQQTETSLQWALPLSMCSHSFPVSSRVTALIHYAPKDSIFNQTCWYCMLTNGKELCHCKIRIYMVCKSHTIALRWETREYNVQHLLTLHVYVKLQCFMKCTGAGYICYGLCWEQGLTNLYLYRTHNSQNCLHHNQNIHLFCTSFTISKKIN